MDKQSLSKLGRVAVMVVRRFPTRPMNMVRNEQPLWCWTFVGADSAGEHWCYCSLILVSGHWLGKRAWKASLRLFLLDVSKLRGERKSASKLFLMILECYAFSILMQKENLHQADRNHHGLWCLQMTLWCTVSTSEEYIVETGMLKAGCSSTDYMQGYPKILFSRTIKHDIKPL